MKIEDYAINMIDNLPIGEAIKVVSYYDSRPLTEETLKELGFVKGLSGDGKLKTEHWELGLHYCLYLKTYEVTADGNHTAYFKSDTIDYPIKYKTVGKIKTLIEALKGDE